MKYTRIAKKQFRFKSRVGDEGVESLAYAFARNHGLKRQTEKNIIKRISHRSSIVLAMR